MHEFVTIVAKYLLIISVLGALYVFWQLDGRDKKRFLVEALVGAVIAYGLAKLGSQFYNNPRPFVEGNFTPYFSHGADNGFPSDHTLLASYLGFLVLKYHKNLGYFLLVGAALIGAARVIAGVHHTIDIIGAFIFAALGAWLAWVIVKKLPSPGSHKQSSNKNSLRRG